MEQKRGRKIFKRIGAIVCSLALTIVAFMLPFSTSFKNNLSAKNLIASADEIEVAYHYRSNDMYYISAVAVNAWTPVGSMYVLFNGYLDYSVTNGLSFRSISYATETGTLDVNYGLMQEVILYDSGYNLLVSGNTNTNFSIQRGRAYAVNSYYNNQSLGFFDYIYSSSNFNANVYKIEMFVSETNEFYPNGRSGFSFWNIKYYDVNNEYFVHSFLTTTDYMFNSRTYYIQNPDTFTDNQFYKEGYSAGESAGYSAGETAGYSSGYKAGETIGYNNGYSAGVELGGEYTFFSLISAVIDAPIQAFMGLFNFELLGINLAGFFTGLLTLAFIITIVRLVMP